MRLIFRPNNFNALHRCNNAILDHFKWLANVAMLIGNFKVLYDRFAMEMDLAK